MATCALLTGAKPSVSSQKRGRLRQQGQQGTLGSSVARVFAACAGTAASQTSCLCYKIEGFHLADPLPLLVEVRLMGMCI